MMSKYKLIVGLGNPGKEHLLNRHNIGFIILDSFVKELGNFEFNPKFHGEVIKIGDLVFLKPHTFMNLSGKSVSEVCSFYKIAPSEILIIQDELDLEFGKVKISTGSGDAGHNGIKDIIAKLGTKEFTRLRFGVGRPEGYQPVEDYVLSDFSKTELEAIYNFKLSDYLN
jgi:PTH1 family peptidyl-tRNA hydrolase